jgi:acetyl esterase/lipase
LDGDDTHLRFWHEVQTDLKVNNIPIAFLFVEYTLVPHATYPTPIVQAIEATNHVLTELKRPASDIILAGDSAGGNMSLGVLSQIMHPSPELPNVQIPEGQNLKALVLIAPWVSFRLDWPSVQRNEHKDLLSQYAGHKWSTDYMAGKESTPFAEPLHAPPDWWKNPRVDQILATAGSDESLLDQIAEWVDKFKVSVQSLAVYRSMAIRPRIYG